MILAALALVSCTRGPKGLSRSEFPAVEKGLAAVQRAFEYRDAGVLIFEPRMLDTERALDEARAASSNNQDGVAVSIFESTVQLISTYRRYQEMLRDIDRRETGEETLKLANDISNNAVDVQFQIKRNISDLWSFIH